jgi:hypothetical protein
MTKKALTKAQLQAEQDYQKLLKKWESVPKFARASVKGPVKPLEPPKLVIRTGAVGQSLVTPGGSTALKEPAKYTGTEMLGIAQMHKSNAVPIFNSKAAVEVTQMRRG